MLASEHAIAPIFFEAATQDPSPDLTLRDLLEPFENRLRQPYVKFSQGSGRARGRAGRAAAVSEAIGMVMSPRERVSMVLRLEELGPRRASYRPLDPWLDPFLPLANGTTAHVYVSSEGASALANHTDVTEILVVQLLGQKEWLHCREKTNLAPFLAVPQKLDLCTT